MIWFWLLPPIVYGWIFAARRNHRIMLRLMSDRPLRRESIAHYLPDLLALVALILILFSLQPSRSMTRDQQAGPAIALVVDVSKSMQATDRQPNRMTLAKHELLILLDAFPDARFSLLPFAGEAVVQVPLTGDRDGLRFFINNLHTGLIESPGSAPEEAVLLAQKNLKEVESERLIILLSDGERTIAEKPPELSDSIPVYSIMTGTAEGGRIGTLQTAVSRADPERLAAISMETGGRVLDGTLLAPAVTDLPLSKKRSDSTTPPATQLALVIALGLLSCRWFPPGSSTGRFAAISLLLVLISFSGCDRSTADQPRTLFENGMKAASRNDLDQAMELFSLAASGLDAQQRGTALYNQGTLMLENGQSDAAIVLFDQAQRLIPGDAMIRDNLLLALAQHDAISADGQGKRKALDSGTGAEMSPEQALRLVEGVRLDPAAPPAEAKALQPTVLKEW